MAYTVVILAIAFIIAWQLSRRSDLKKQEHLKQQIDWIKQIVSSDDCLSDNEKDNIIDFAKSNNLSSREINLIISYILKMSETVEPQVQVIDKHKKNGRDFEDYVVKIAAYKGNGCEYILDAWAGDKYIDGIYPKSNCGPDMRIEVKVGVEPKDSKGIFFSIECKWRSQFNVNKSITIAREDQLENYRQCEKKMGHPVFIILGLGGTGANPKGLYIIPLDEIKGCDIVEKDLKKFKRHNKDKLYYDIRTSQLS